MGRFVYTVLLIVLCIIVLAVGSVVIRDGSDLIANVGVHIMNLFK